MVVNADGWANVLTGLGTSADAGLYTLPSGTLLSEDMLRRTFVSDSMARKIVRAEPYYAFKEGYSISAENSEAEIKNIQKRLKLLQANEKIQEAWMWARLYGFSAIVMASNDTGGDMSQPVGKVRSLPALLVFESPDIHPANADLVTEPSDPHYGTPVLYQINRGGVQQFVHHSRCILFYGFMLPREDFERNNYKGGSVLQGVFSSLQAWATAHQSLPAILKDFTQVIYQIKDLSSQLQVEGGEAAVVGRFRVMQKVSSILNAIILDTDETMEKKSTTVSGLKDLVDLCRTRLVAETGIPHTVLLGESASGLGATGEDLRLNWFDHVRTQQENIVEPALRTIIETIQKERNRAFEYDIEFNNLWKPTPKEEQEARFNQAKTDEIYAGMGLSPEKIFMARFGGEKFSHELRVEPEDLDPDEEGDDEEETVMPSEQAASTSRKTTVRPDGLLREIADKIALKKPLTQADVAALVGAFARLDAKDPIFSALGGDSMKACAMAKWQKRR